MRPLSLIFDIDGTLIDSYKIAGVVYQEALLETITGAVLKPEWKLYENVTDSGIIKEVLADNGIEEGEYVSQVRDCFMPKITTSLAETPCVEIAGSQSFFADCQRRHQVGIATGCWKTSGEIKLRSAGFDWGAAYMSSSCDYDSREDILRNCLRHLGGDDQRVVYFGDAEWDVKTTNNLGWQFIGIGEKLRGKCEHWFPDYTQPDKIWEVLRL